MLQQDILFTEEKRAIRSRQMMPKRQPGLITYCVIYVFLACNKPRPVGSVRNEFC